MRQLAIALLFVGLCQAEDQPFVVASADSTFQGGVYECQLTLSQLKAAPVWDSDTNPPPLTPHKAMAVAIAYAESVLGPLASANIRIDSGTPAWIPLQTELIQFMNTDMWYYRIQVRPFLPGSNSVPAVTLFVIMDGRVRPLSPRKGAAKVTAS